MEAKGKASPVHDSKRHHQMQPYVQKRFEKQTMSLIDTISSNDNPFESHSGK